MCDCMQVCVWQCVCACVLIIVISSYPLVCQMHFARKAHYIHSGICCKIDKLLALIGALYKHTTYIHTHTHIHCMCCNCTMKLSSIS